MTREEAIKHLEKWLDERMWRCFGEEDRKAIRMAISALKDEPLSHEEAWAEIESDLITEVIDHDREWIIGCIKHDGFIHTHRFDKANQIILEALEPKDGDLISRTDAIERVELITKCEWDNNVIYRDEVIDALKFAPSADAVSREEYDKLLNDSIWQAERMKKQLEYRAELSADAVQGWIPCSERLPDWKDMVEGVIITTENGRVTFADYCTENGTFHDVGQDVWASDILAWMPLPKPYKGGDDE